MEAPVVRSRGRPRKRRINEEENSANGGKTGSEAKKRVVEMVPISLLGRFVLKEFKGNGIFIGKVVYYADGLYRVVYEDGDFEDLDSREIRLILLGENYFDDDLSIRSKKLEELVQKTSKNEVENKVLESTKEVDGVKDSTLSENDEACVEDDGAYLSNDSCEYGKDGDLGFEAEAPSVPPPQLPPSSGTAGVPEQYVSHLFSVYGFLRSFSICLFLSPFTLDDFVGSLNCRAPNTLLDAIHVALLRVLRRHLETLSSEGSELASKCLRCIDWSLLDTLTWPVYLIQYLTVRGYTKGPQWKGFYDEVLEEEYYLLSTGRKLVILQILCDDALESAELRAEMDLREESEVGIEYDAEATNTPENGPRRVHPRYPKISACKDREALEIISDTHQRKSTKGDTDATNMDVDRNSDECRLCGMDGTLLCCDGCPSAYHTRCIGVMKMSIPEGSWYCPECTINKIGPAITIGTSLKGAELFSIDSYGQIFVGTCDHLLVLKDSTTAEQCLRYYNLNDIPKVLQVLCSSSQHAELYLEMCQAILRHWDIQGNSNIKELQCMLNLKLREGNQSTGLVSEQAVPAGSSHQSFINMSANISNGNGSYIGHANVKPYPVTLSSLGKEANHVTPGKGDNISLGDYVYMGSIFKPQAYINHYTHGDFAASAAAKLAVLSSEETRPSDAHASENHRKALSNTINLQAKAFSLAVSRFFWPSSEKKLVEVPRERCGWCLSCKAAISSKRGCMLNHAALSATKSAMRILSNLRPVKSGEGSVASIATYILYMEESLYGLVVGPFLYANYRKQWRKRVEQASTVSEVKALLLELEENIRIIAVSGDWIKLVDDWLVESSVMQSASSTVGTSQKRVPSGRRNRKLSATSEVTADGCPDKSFVWWQGGQQMKLIFQKAILPRLMVRRAARQGGWKKIAGIYYTDGSEISKRTRQLVWRAAVEMSKNASQLSLQVRYLDSHVRWGDLVRPDQNLAETKNLETEASVFRNASICDKKIVENKIRYGIAFGNQKHLPSRVMKNVIEVEQDQNGKGKYWFPETRVPLYLIREYEGGLNKAVVPSMKEPLNLFLKLRKRQMKACHKDTFFYLQCKRENMDMRSCCSCQMVVILRHAVTCYACQGFSHRDCTISSAIATDEEVEFVILCKRCYNAKALDQNEICNESPTTPLNLQMQEYKSLVTVTKGSQSSGKAISNHRVQDTRETKQITSDSNVTTKSRRRLCNWGVIWKKKNKDDTGSNFRQNNILLSGGAHVHRLEPVCHLCRQPYRSDLMYICCETCNHWYHAEAVELEESQVFDVVGFKCCRCRRIKSPACPYKPPEDKKEEKKSSIKTLKQESSGVGSDFGTIVDSTKCKLNTPIAPMAEVSKQNDDLPLFSISRVELIPEPNSEVDIELDSAGPAPRKLPVRRHMKREEELDTVSESNFSTADLSANTGFEHPGKPTENVLLDNLQWSASVDGLESAAMFDGEDFEVEPQTLFTFSELLGVDASGDMLENQEKSIPEDEIFQSRGTFNMQSEPIMSAESAVDLTKCQMCALAKPAPDLSCQNCGLWMHSQCLPQTEQSSRDGSWECSHCREWC